MFVSKISVASYKTYNSPHMLKQHITSALHTEYRGNVESPEKRIIEMEKKYIQIMQVWTGLV